MLIDAYGKFSLVKGSELEIKELTTKLVLLGYSKENMTSQEGSWSRRGEIIDIYPVNNELPISCLLYTSPSPRD